MAGMDLPLWGEELRDERQGFGIPKEGLGFRVSLRLILDPIKKSTCKGSLLIRVPYICPFNNVGVKDRALGFIGFRGTGFRAYGSRV